MKILRFFLGLTFASAAIFFFGIRAPESWVRDFTLSVAFVINVGAFLFCAMALTAFTKEADTRGKISEEEPES